MNECFCDLGCVVDYSFTGADSDQVINLLKE